MAEPNLRVVSFNVLYSLRQKRLAESVFDAFSKINADVICLQEVLISERRNFAHDLSNALGMHLSFSLRRDYGTHRIGLAMLSRVRPEKNISMVLPRSSVARPRIAQIVQFNHKGISWRVANTHLSITYSNTRKIQIEAILDSLNHQPSRLPLVLAGDFNTYREKEIADFEEILFHAGFVLPKTLPYSWRMLGAEAQLDWIVAQHCNISAVKTLPLVKGSDHKPIFADVAFVPSKVSRLEFKKVEIT